MGIGIQGGTTPALMRCTLRLLWCTRVFVFGSALLVSPHANSVNPEVVNIVSITANDDKLEVVDV